MTQHKVFSRGAQKIDQIVRDFRAFGLDFRGKTVLDIGSSTGGFTSVALKNGAKHVIAVEKGSHQMRAPLRFDPRVSLYEQSDIFTFSLSQPVQYVLIDLSFVSLTKALAFLPKLLFKNPLLPKNTATTVEVLALFKPQFEAQKDELVRGVVKNNTIRRRLIHEFEDWLKTADIIVIAKKDSPFKGRFGNLERFYYLRLRAA